MSIYSIISIKVNFRKKGISMVAIMSKEDPKKVAELVESSICVFMGTSEDGGILIFIPNQREKDLEKVRVECER